MSDPAQFETFLVAYQDMVYSTAYRLLSQEAEARDVSQSGLSRKTATAVGDV